MCTIAQEDQDVVSLAFGLAGLAVAMPAVMLVRPWGGSAAFCISTGVAKLPRSVASLAKTVREQGSVARETSSEKHSYTRFQKTTSSPLCHDNC